MSDLEKRQGRSKKKVKKAAAMRPDPTAPAGMERDSHGHAIPLKDRLPEDRAKARNARDGKNKAAKK